MPLTDLLVHWWFPLTPLIGFSGLAVSSNAIVCPAGLNGRTDELSLFPSVESFIRAQGASTSNTLQRRHASTTARHGSVYAMQPSSNDTASMPEYEQSSLSTEVVCLH